MTTADHLSDTDDEGIRDAVALACLHGTDDDQLDTPDGSLRLVAATRVAAEHPWEHQRLIFASHPLLRSMERDRWQIVGVWGPWTYLKRPAATSPS